MLLKPHQISQLKASTLQTMYSESQHGDTVGNSVELSGKNLGSKQIVEQSNGAIATVTVAEPHPTSKIFELVKS